MTDAVAEYDQSNLEDAVSAALEKRLGGSAPSIFESSTFGVVAFERLTGSDLRRVDWQEVAAELARETGIGVVCVANCDWTFDDRCDEEATFLAFDLPTVTGGYRDDPYRNCITPVEPATAPAQTDFDDLRRARRIVDSHVLELHARMETLVAAGRSERDTLGRIAEIESLKNLAAGDREAVKAVLALDFDAALREIPHVEEPASPKM